MLPPRKPRRAVYVHIPFCSRRCPYCDFNVYVAKPGSSFIEGVIDAICSDIGATQMESSEPVAADTIFFGGGTPSYVAPYQLAQVMAAVLARFEVAHDAEISLEANPSSADRARFAEIRSIGFNRINIGVQSFDDRLLGAIGRDHTGSDAVRSMNDARAAGFQTVGLDLMYRLPGQSLSDWSAALTTAVELGPEHVSCYSLTVEPHTRFARLARQGSIALPDEDCDAEMYEMARDRLNDAGLLQYEVSNFAKSRHRCRHNMTYWNNGEYMGFGPGAVGYIRGRRLKREPRVRHYVEATRSGIGIISESEMLPPERALGETLMVGLRTVDGVDLADLTQRFGVDPRLVYRDGINRIVSRGLARQVGTRLLPTPQGIMLANVVALEFV
ncbi:MAG: radical SAM family heme chaperone HemW [Armatimonadetes bacterium]|nr:radical SAM family heme chaperone HemW [Armatimonadota bacterium]MDE2205968.1 radical SAM family heme chaperone HemW [Armatimonadota bacterium]